MDSEARVRGSRCTSRDWMHTDKDLSFQQRTPQRGCNLLAHNSVFRDCIFVGSGPLKASRGWCVSERRKTDRSLRMQISEPPTGLFLIIVYHRTMLRLARAPHCSLEGRRESKGLIRKARCIARRKTGR